MSSELKLKSQVQAIDPMTGVWLPGKITDVRKHEVNISWKWYKASTWVSLSDVRSPIIKRTVKLDKKDWTVTDPSKCQRGDVLFVKKPDGTLGEQIEVRINDPWNCKTTSNNNETAEVDRTNSGVQAPSAENSSEQATRRSKATSAKQKGKCAVQVLPTESSSRQAITSSNKKTTISKKTTTAVHAQSRQKSSGQASTETKGKRRVPLSENNGNVIETPQAKKTKSAQGKENQAGGSKPKTKSVTKEKAVSIALGSAAREIYQQKWTSQEKEIIDRASVGELLDTDQHTLIKFGVKTLEAMECDDEPSQQPPPRKTSTSTARNAAPSLWHRPVSPAIEPESQLAMEEPSSPCGPSPPPPFIPTAQQLEEPSSNPGPGHLPTFEPMGSQFLESTTLQGQSSQSTPKPTAPYTFHRQWQQTQPPIWQPFRETVKSAGSQDLHGRVAALEMLLQSEKKKVEGLEQLITQESANRLALERKLEDFMKSGVCNSTPTMQTIPCFSSPPFAGGTGTPLPYTEGATEKDEKNHFSHLRSILATVLSADGHDGPLQVRPNVISALLLNGANEPTVLARNLMRKVFTPFELANCNVRGIKKEGFDPRRVLAIKTSVVQCFQIPHMLQESTWHLCIKAMDTANRNARRYARKLSM